METLLPRIIGALLIGLIGLAFALGRSCSSTGGG